MKHLDISHIHDKKADCLMIRCALMLMMQMLLVALAENTNKN